MEMIRARGGFVFKVHGGETMMNGLPDICGVYQGKSIWLEVKTPGGRVSKIQEYRHQAIRDAGGYVCVPRSVKEASDWLLGLSNDDDNVAE